MNSAAASCAPDGRVLEDAGRDNREEKLEDSAKEEASTVSHDEEEKKEEDEGVEADGR